MKIHSYLLIPYLFTCSFGVYSQTAKAPEAKKKVIEDVVEVNTDIGTTFNTTRVINGHSVETLKQGSLEFRLGHRFGDIGGDNGGVQTLYGFDNAADIRFGLEYGVTNDLMIGIGRSKGINAPYRSLLDGFVKYRLLKQKKGGMPISLAVAGTASYTYMKAGSDLTEVNSFPKQSNRLAYSTQLNIAKKFGDRVSLALIPTVVHRNLVKTDDVNTLFALGGAARVSVTSAFSILLEYYYDFHKSDVRTTNTNSLGIGFEFVTHGHSFVVNFTNSKGFGETQFIPYTYEDWLTGQFRLGFSLTRAFLKY